MENFIGNLNENRENLFLNENQRKLADLIGNDGVLYSEDGMLDEEMIGVDDVTGEVFCVSGVERGTSGVGTGLETTHDWVRDRGSGDQIDIK